MDQRRAPPRRPDRAPNGRRLDPLTVLQVVVALLRRLRATLQIRRVRATTTAETFATVNTTTARDSQ